MLFHRRPVRTSRIRVRTSFLRSIFFFCKALFGHPINLSGHPIPIMPKNVFLVGLGLGFDVLIYIHHYRRERERGEGGGEAKNYALSGHPINLSEHLVPIMPKHVFLVGLGLGFDELIYIQHYRRERGGGYELRNSIRERREFSGFLAFGSQLYDSLFVSTHFL